MNKILKPIPEIGKYYHFFDDGKTSPSRHYICKCERIVTPEEAKNIIVDVSEYDYEKDENFFVKISLYDHWHNNEMPNHDWIYENETDYFVECSCPNYDNNNLWFVRTKNGGWFSINIQRWWQSGRLDVDGEIFQRVLNHIKEHPEWYDVDDAIQAYNVNYEKQ